MIVSALPVIGRELLSSARQPATYWVRVLGVAAFLGVLFLVVGLAEATGPDMGRILFGALHCSLLCAIWVLVPVLAADCISKERREGTLPLLFLTPLTAREIVYAKGMAHGLRAVTLWLAMLPMLTVPLLAGGVGMPEILVSALVNLTSLCLATAAGILASALSRAWPRALSIALCLAFVFAALLLLTLPMIVDAMGRFAPRWRRYDPGLGVGLAYMANAGGVWHDWASRFRSSPWRMLHGYAVVAVASGLVLLLAISLAAWCVQRVWREAPPSARVQWLKNTLTRPVFFQRWLKLWLHWQLHRNPIGWLEQRDWSSRLVVWSWFAVVVCIYSSLFANLYIWQRAFHGVQSLLASLLAGSIALSAAGSFRRERESGVLELLLVAPIEEWQIILGRLRGLWTQFLPSIVLLCSVWLYCATFMGGHNEASEVVFVLFYCVAFATLPVIGLFYSLAGSNYIASLLWTLLVGIAIPTILGRLVVSTWDLESSTFLRLMLPAIVQIVIAWLLALRLHHNLRHRKFKIQAGAG